MVNIALNKENVSNKDRTTFQYSVVYAYPPPHSSLAAQQTNAAFLLWLQILWSGALKTKPTKILTHACISKMALQLRMMVQ